MDQRFPVILLDYYHTVILILKNINFVLYFHARFVFLRAKQYRVEKMTQNSFRKHLSMPGMLREVREYFDSVPDPVASRGLTLSDCLMTVLAVFSLKMMSMLSFDVKIRLDESSVPAQNFKSLFGVDRIPSDTRVRERLDNVDPHSVRPAFKNVFTGMQRGKVLENWTVLGGHYLIAIDGTGTRSSHKVKCEKCCVKNHRNGSTTYFHQMLGAAMIPPDHSVVLPLAPEPIQKEDGATKNDCERNAAKRLLDDLRRQPTEGLSEPRNNCVSTKCLQIELAKVSPRVCLGAEINERRIQFLNCAFQKPRSG